MGKKVKSHWDEQWEMLVGEHPTKQKDYYFSNYGRLKSIDKVTEDEALLRGSTTIRGYKQINITFVGNIRKGFYVQKLVAEAFCPKKHDGQRFVVHLDGNLANNHWKNLMWVDQQEMTEFQIEKGVYHHSNRKIGSHCKLNKTRVKLLKQKLKEGKTKKKILAKTFNITVEQLRKIEKGIDWGYVTID